MLYLCYWKVTHKVDLMFGKELNQLNVVSLLKKGLNVVSLLKERTQCRIFNLRWKKVSMSYLHILQHGCVILVILSGDLSKINDPLVSVQGQNEEERPSRLSTRSVQKSILATLSS